MVWYLGQLHGIMACMSNDQRSFRIRGSDVPIPLAAPRIVWHYTVTQWRRAFGLNISQIDELLFVGGEFRAAQWPSLHLLGVRAVLSLQAEREDEFDGPPPERALRLPVPDFYAPTLDQIAEAVQFTRAAHADRLPVLIHCHAGVGRAALTASAFLISQGATRAEALERIRRARPIVALNPLQHNRLLEWERLVHGEEPK
jgi:predicted protein tyrosine phosphatase